MNWVKARGWYIVSVKNLPSDMEEGVKALSRGGMVNAKFEAHIKPGKKLSNWINPITSSSNKQSFFSSRLRPDGKQPTIQPTLALQHNDRKLDPFTGQRGKNTHTMSVQLNAYMATEGEFPSINTSIFRHRSFCQFPQNYKRNLNECKSTR